MAKVNRMERVVVVDLGAVELACAPGAVTATLSATGEFLGTRAPARGESPRESAAHLLDEVLATARLWRDGGWRRVVLYNPHTARMSVGTAKGSTAMWAGGPVPLDADGTLADLRGDTLTVGDRVATVEEVDLVAIEGMLTAHAAR